MVLRIMSTYYSKLGVVAFDDTISVNCELLSPLNSSGRRNDNIGSIKKKMLGYYCTPIHIDFIDNSDIEIHLVDVISEELTVYARRSNIVEVHRNSDSVSCWIHSPQIDKITNGVGVSTAIDINLVVKLISHYDLVKGVIQGKFILGVEPSRKFGILGIHGVVDQNGVLPTDLASNLKIFDKVWEYNRRVTKFKIGHNYVFSNLEDPVEYTYLGRLNQIPLTGKYSSKVDILCWDVEEPTELKDLTDANVFVRLNPMCSLISIPDMVSGILIDLVSSVSKMDILVYPTDTKLHMLYTGKSILCDSLNGFDLSEFAKKLALSRIKPSDEKLPLYYDMGGKSRIHLLLEDEGINYSLLAIDRISGDLGKQINTRYSRLWEELGLEDYEQLKIFNEKS